MLKGLVVFTSQHDEAKVTEILGFSLVHNSRSRFEDGYRIQKYNVKGSEFYVTIIRSFNVAQKAKKLARKLGNCPTFVFPPSGYILPSPSQEEGVKTLSCVNDVFTMIGTAFSPVECNALQQLFDAYTPNVFENPETPGEAETEFATQFFSNMNSGRRTRAPDPDLFQGAVFFMPSQGRITIVQNSSSDEDDTNLQAAIDASMNYTQPIREESPEKKRRVPPTWKSVLREPEPIVVGAPSCITCHTHRASICFVDCGHQVMCDLCVRQMCELPGVRKTCPVCRCASECILRPVVSEVEK
jgi:hypothetical protein